MRKLQPQQPIEITAVDRYVLESFECHDDACASGLGDKYLTALSKTTPAPPPQKRSLLCLLRIV